MKVLILNYEFPPLGGGAARATKEILSCFRNTNDLEIDLVTSSIDSFIIETFSPQIRIHRLDISKGGNLHYQSNRELLSYTKKALGYSRQLCRDTQYDLVHAFFGIPCGYIARKLKCPYIVSLRGSDVPFYNRRFRIPDRLLFRGMSRTIWRKAASVIPNSAGLRELALRTSPELELPVIPNGVDTEFFSPDQKKIPSKELRLVSTGRLIARKGYADLIRALSGVTGVSLTLAGHGNLREELEELARQLDVPCSFTGPLDKTGIRNLLRNSDLFVLPSRNEGMSNSILEAMACGLPVITTDTGGSSELIAGNGTIVPIGDIETLQQAVLKYRDNREVLKKAGEKSRQKAMNMSWTATAESYLKLYKKIVREQSR